MEKVHYYYQRTTTYYILHTTDRRAHPPPPSPQRPKGTKESAAWGADPALAAQGYRQAPIEMRRVHLGMMSEAAVPVCDGSDMDYG